MKTYLVTGGAGFIGSHLVDFLLNKGYQVLNVDDFNTYYHPQIKMNNIKDHLSHKNYTLIKGDITNYDLLEGIFRNNKIDTIVHLAARAGVRPSLEDPILYQEVNGRGTNNILELSKKYDVKKLVLASSSSVYGNNEKVPFAETDIVDYSISPYAATKKANEVLGHVYHKLYNMDMIFLRFFTVYGPRQRPDLAIHKFTKLIDQGQPIPFYGDGSNARDYTYIDDIIDGVTKSIKYVEENSNVYEILNLGESSPIRLDYMVKTIEEALGKKAVIQQLPMQLGDVNQTFADITKAKALIDYNPKTDFKIGIEKFILWYKNTKN